MLKRRRAKGAVMVQREVGSAADAGWTRLQFLSIGLGGMATSEGIGTLLPSVTALATGRHQEDGPPYSTTIAAGRCTERQWQHLSVLTPGRGMA